MRKIIAFLGMFIGLYSYSNADEMTYKGENVWRSSFTETGEQNAVIATHTVVLKIKIEAAGSSDATLQVYSGGSSTADAVKVHELDTSNNMGETFLVQYSTPRYNNNGTTPAKVKFYWNWKYDLLTLNDPKGKY